MKNFKLAHEGSPLLNAMESEQRHVRREKNRGYAAISLAARFALIAAGMAAMPSAYAICVPNIPGNVACLADQPIQSAVSIKPNVMFILDNSGSMAWDVLAIDTGTTDWNTNTTKFCRENHNYNGNYYNPNFNYTAAVPQTPDPTTGAMVSMGSQTWPYAKVDPYTSATTTNLGTSFKGYQTTSGNDTAQPAYYMKYIGPPAWNMHDPSVSGDVPGVTCDTNNAHYQKIIVSSTSCVAAANTDVYSCPTGADERVNFANWYSYYRTHINMAKSSMANAFATIDDHFRVGFHTINNPSANNSTGASQTINDFSGGGTGTPKGIWYSKLTSLVPNGGTPSQDAVDRVGQYYSGSTSVSGLPINGSNPDPVQYSCQKNFAIFATDGFWNSPTTARGDQDATVPNPMPIKAGNSVYNISDTGLTPGVAFPTPFLEGPAVSDSLADIAMYYWIHDLRTTGAVSANNVPTSSSDPAYWQHMNTFAVGMGVYGTLTYPTDLAALTSGAKVWPLPVHDTLTAVDDLWHAAVNGHGQYYQATNPAQLANSLTSALRAITDAPTYGVGPSSSTNDFKSSDQTDYSTYVSSYRLLDWSGDVVKYSLDHTTGAKILPSLWSAAKQLDLKVNPGLTSTVSTTAFTSRNIVTRKENGTVISFDYPSLSTTQQTALCYKVSPGTGSCVASDTSLVDYLRGDAKYEGDYGIGGSRFRNRHDATELTYYKRDLMGTIVNAQPAYVAAEDRGYTDTGYLQFATASNTRTPMLYVPANDGMVHAFNTATGNEVWAYIPSFLIPTASDEVGKEKGLRAISYQDGGAPPYNQHFYIDATPNVAAVDFSTTGGSGPYSANDWHNILIGGLGKGGKGYYALDVTTPAVDMASAKSKVLWEFPSAADPTHAAVIAGGQMGYSFANPIIAKVPAWGWVVIVPSGFNNTDPAGLGYLFVLNAKTGALLETLHTPVAAPGMAYVTTLVHVGTQEVHGVYSGDLNGTLWRFDFNVPALTNNATHSTQRVWQLFSSSPTTPIGSEVDVEIDANTKERWVFFGTGQYLDVPDRSTTAGQYLVGLKDGVAPTDPSADFPNISGIVAPLSSLTVVPNMTTGLASEPTPGWKYLLPTSGERVSVKPIADLQTVVFISLVPTTDPCSPGSSAYVYALGYANGANRLQNSSGVQIPPLYVPTGVAGVSIQMTGKTAIPASNGSPTIQILTRDGQVVSGGTLDTSLIPAGTRHVGWREVGDEN